MSPVQFRIAGQGRRVSQDGRWTITRRWRPVKSPSTGMVNHVAEWLLEDATGATESLLCDRLVGARAEVDRRSAATTEQERTRSKGD